MNDLQRVISKSADGEKIPDSLMILLDVGRESELQHEIRDIIDELNMMINVARQQEEMIKRFIDIAQTILKPRKDEDTKFSKGKSRSVLTSTESTEKLLVLTELDLVDSQDHDSQTTLASDESNLDKVKLKAFQKRAADLKSDMWVRMKELESLRESADTTAKNVRNSEPQDFH